MLVSGRVTSWKFRKTRRIFLQLTWMVDFFMVKVGTYPHTLSSLGSD